jgi:hypothetical protein
MKASELVIWVRLFVVVSKRKISELPSGLDPVRSASPKKAMRVASALIEAPPDPPTAECVICVALLVEVSNRKISKFPSALPPVKSAVELKPMQVPSALIEGTTAEPVAELVSCVRLFVVVSKRKISALPSALPPVRFALEIKAIRVPAALITGRSVSILPPVPPPLVIWVKVNVVVSKRKNSRFSNGLPPVRSDVE